MQLIIEAVRYPVRGGHVATEWALEFRNTGPNTTRPPGLERGPGGVHLSSLGVVLLHAHLRPYGLYEVLWQSPR